MINQQNSKKLSDLGVKCLSGKEYYNKTGSVWTVGKLDKRDTTPAYNLDSILTKEALIKVFGEGYDHEFAEINLVTKCTMCGLDASEWGGSLCEEGYEYYRNKLAEIYSEQGYPGLDKFFEEYF